VFFDEWRNYAEAARREAARNSNGAKRNSGWRDGLPDWLVHFKDLLEADNLADFLKNKGKDIVSDAVAEHVKKVAGFDPRTKPGCLLAGMMIIKAVVDGGHYNLPPAQAAAEGATALSGKNAAHDAAVALCINQGGGSTGSITVAREWLRFEQNRPRDP
jgi:hypothetical protein